MATYEMKFMFDWLSGTCVWSVNDAAHEKYDYPVDLSKLPITPNLLKRLQDLVEWHDEALNWDDPGSGLVWDEAQIATFDEKAIALYHELCQQLGADYEINLFEGSQV